MVWQITKLERQAELSALSQGTGMSLSAVGLEQALWAVSQGVHAESIHLHV